MKDNYHKGNLENKISMVLFWIYLFAVAIIFIRGLILFVSKWMVIYKYKTKLIIKLTGIKSFEN